MTKMTARKKQEWLGAIGKLERFYRAVVAGKNPEYFDCPLCEVRGPCEECLWYLYEKQGCCRGRFPRYLRELCDIPWAKSSLRRLARWRKRLEANEKKIDNVFQKRQVAKEKLMSPKRIPK